ncbi:heat shock 70 kDa protein 12A, putative [Rhizoctonia solani AG-3 Rhs1AP]|uniref:Heat shock 70 kDa protein 12A, putative n=1 Tax=Rhizoctonia solani AG-3 Rhs1AP TaxID=1086054 RepID=X8J8G2_9AGAM|nr:heat shock 70 kDa protein 12A, putative [Rhizoctonia solani AG-3 Rhs1AP]
MDPFHGSWDGETKIVVGIDIGTTHTCVSFILLHNGCRPDIYRITKWPGQEAADQQSKVPTVVWYNTDKKAVAFGAEALSSEAEVRAEENGWFLAKRFKLHLYPHEMTSKHGIEPDPLPPGVSLLQVYSDFLGYIFKHTKSYFEDRVLDGATMWDRYSQKIELSMAHPNGWGNQAHMLLRSAVVAAGFARKATAKKIRFTTEPDALASFFIHRLNLWSAVQVGLNLIVYHSDNAETQINSYTIASIRPAPMLRELDHSTYFQGVGTGMSLASEALKGYIQTTLEEAGIDREDIESYTSRGIKDFENVRRSFSGDDTDSPGRDLAIQLGWASFNRPASGIHRGHMSIPTAKVKSFFEPCVDEIKTTIGPRIKDTHVSFVFSTGEITDVPYLRQAFEQHCNPQGCLALFPISGYSNPSISDGVIVRYLINSANERRVRMSFGFETSVQFDYNVSEHRGRLVTLAPSGLKIIRGKWDEIACEHIPLEKGVTVTKPISLTFPSSRPEPDEFELRLYSYSGEGAPSWMRDKQGRLLSGFREWVVIAVDLTKLSDAVESRVGAYGITSWYLGFDICLQLSDVGLSAHIQWKQEGKIQTAPAKIIAPYRLYQAL